MGVTTEDLAFIERAYAVHLKRAVDPAGLRTFLDRRLAGASRDALLAELRSSDEANAGPRPAADRHGLSDDEWHGRTPASLQRLLSAGDDAFVELAYRQLLGRAPDRAGRAHCLHALGAGTPRAHVLRRLSGSPEGRLRGVRIDGLPDSGWLRFRIETLVYGGLRRWNGLRRVDPTL